MTSYDCITAPYFLTKVFPDGLLGVKYMIFGLQTPRLLDVGNMLNSKSRQGSTKNCDDGTILSQCLLDRCIDRFSALYHEHRSPHDNFCTS